MIMICQIFVLVLIIVIVWYLGYCKGKTIKERELINMVEPTVNKFENEYQKYLKFCKIMDEILTEDDNDDLKMG